MKATISFDVISKYRTEWMGIAMLQVLLYHIIDGWLGYGEFFNTLDGWTCVFFSFLHTKAFLFLSGFGLFYSMTKNGDLGRFYSNRILRLFPAYLLCSIFWYVYRDLIQQHDFIRLFADLSLTSFWGWGNEWYLAISLFLYFVFPLYFYCICNRGLRWHFFCLFFVICIIFAANMMVAYTAPDYYEMIRIGVSKLHYFFIGAFVADLSIKKVKCNATLFSVVLVGVYILHVFIKRRFYTELFPELFYDLMYEMALFGALMLLCNYTEFLKRVKLLTWMGKYSLEIYVIHMYMYKVFTRIYDCEYYLIIVLLCTVFLPYPIHLLSGKINSTINDIVKKVY